MREAMFRGGGGARNIASRIHLGKDGTITLMAGKVEAGQGSRAELSQAAAEELRVPIGRILSAPALAQRRGGRGGGGARNIASRIHLGKDGTITLMAGKVEAGQGSRAE